jgi:N-acetylmuramoyl-L-alanine amidase
MREIKYIVVHCTATPPETKVENIKRYWKEQLGWKNPGYHYIIKRSGEIVQLNAEENISNGVAGYNSNSIHISYIGGVDGNGKPFDNRTDAQLKAMFDKLVALSEKYPKAIILGHCDFPGVKKACPSFNVKSWLAGYTPDLNTA